ncbi:glutathione S-transferase family protein [Erythrobacter rubeus]|uniref:Glutathione S-transferase family protein n=1 Tax=Erythrobacter rubeus TaxID=2760803 RepID=A0ABR8KUS5_9SPHN|nr:glutathione S-transferase family protein [Erythrobacter rubeus]MBD2841891.1 glutathione S-transferase family protein [Erythrobacter rubeus]
MGVHQTNSTLAKSLVGVHLFHFFMSNCSQRVRFALEEKGIEWTSHHLNLPAREHMTAEYRELNPNGVVPTLVHDGTVIIESNDIIAYIDGAFEGPHLSAQSDRTAVQLEELLMLSDEAQPAIKVLSHELLFKPVRKVTADDVAAMGSEGARPELVAFMRDFSEDGAAWQERVAIAQQNMRGMLARLDACLGDAGSWLLGEQFGLADISWSVNALRLMQARFDTSDWRAFEEWRDRVVARPAFVSAVTQYAPG